MGTRSREESGGDQRWGPEAETYEVKLVRRVFVITNIPVALTRQEELGGSVGRNREVGVRSRRWELSGNVHAAGNSRGRADNLVGLRVKGAHDS